MAPDATVMGGLSLGQAMRQSKCGTVWDLKKGTKLNPQHSGVFTPWPQRTGTPGPPRNLPQTDLVTAVLKSDVCKWILAPAHPLLPEAPLEQHPAILTDRLKGKSCLYSLMVGQKAVTLRAQIPGAGSYDVPVQNRDTLGFTLPAYKTHHFRNVKIFHNESACEVGKRIWRGFFMCFLKICST